MSDIPSASNSSFSSVPKDDTIDRLAEEANRKAREFESSFENSSTSDTGSSSIGDKTRSAADAVGREASGVANDLKDRALNFAETQKRTGADRLSDVAGAVERAAGEIEQESPDAARYIRQAAQGVQRFSSQMRERDIEDIAAQARDIARRQPLLVFGGAVLAGLAIARFLKSSNDHDMASRNAFNADNSYGGSRHEYD